MHTRLGVALEAAAELSIETLSRYLLPLEDSLTRLAGDSRALQLVPLRMTTFRAHWPEPAPHDVVYRRDLQGMLKDLARLRDLLLIPHLPRHPVDPCRADTGPAQHEKRDAQ